MQIVRNDPLLRWISDTIQVARDNGGKPRTWPKHVFCPIYAPLKHIESQQAFALEMARRGYPPDQLGWTTFHLVSSVHVIHSWRATQGIYHFDPDLFAEVCKTKLAGKIPMEVLFQLPEWCIYIQFPEPLKLGSTTAHGFFTTIISDPMEILFSLDIDIPEIPHEPTSHTFAVTLDAHATIEEIIEKTRRRTYQVHADHGNDLSKAEEDHIKLLAENPKYLEMLFSLTIYIASRNAEIENRKNPAAKPHRPVPQKTAQGPRLFPPTGPTVWDVGLRFGAKLRKFRQEHREHQGGTHASPRPHIRSAHWNTYWTGPKSKPQVPIAVWIGPLTIGIGDIIPTIHDIEK